MSNGNTATQLVPESDYAYPTMEEYHRPFNEPEPATPTVEDAEWTFKAVLAAFKAEPRLLETIKRLEERVVQLERNDVSLRGELGSAIDDRENWRHELNNATAELERERQNNSDLTANYASLEAERDQLREANRALNEQLTAVMSQRDQSDQSRAGLTIERDNLATDRDQWRASSQDAWGQLEQAHDERAKWETDCRAEAVYHQQAVARIEQARKLLSDAASVLA